MPYRYNCDNMQFSENIACDWEVGIYIFAIVLI